jgi:Leucine-rich repeat (LRR) protein
LYNNQNSFLLSDLNSFTNLTNLHMSGNSSEKILNLRSCTKLISLILFNFESLINLELNAPNIEHISLSYCTHFVKAPDVSNYTKLKRISLNFCSGLNSLDGISSYVEKLYLSGCSSLTDISILKYCSKLVELKLYKCTKLNDISILGNCVNLTNLDISDINIRGIESLILCPNLSRINMNNSERKYSTEELEKMFQNAGKQLLTKKYNENRRYKEVEYHISYMLD